MAAELPLFSPEAVRAALLAGTEIALIDVREEDPFAQEHPLWAAQMALGRIELDAPWRLPRRDATVVVYDDGEGLAEPAARRLQALGYTAVHLLEGGLQGWRERGQPGGGELFRDVNVPSKSFGELVEHERHTPSLPAEAVKALIDQGADLVVLDARRFDEYQTMSIPTGTSTPGAELVLRARAMAPDPATRIVVNCAGRTRSIIGTQSLVNAGLPNPVAALRNGTIGWTLAGFALDHGQQRRAGAPDAAALAEAQRAAQALADRAGARRLDSAGLAALQADADRTLYCWDVRTPEEYAAGHRSGFGSAPGGQLVQETDVCAPVRGARIVLADGGPRTDGVRAAMTAHWLAQLGWDVAWLGDEPPAVLEAGPWRPAGTPPPAVPLLSPAELADRLAGPPGGHGAAAGRVTRVLDVGTSAAFVKGHVPGAHWVLRSQWGPALAALAAAGPADDWVITCADGRLSPFAAAELAARTGQPVAALAGGTAAWAAAGRPLQAGEAGVVSPRIDRYRRPYEGTDAPHAAMQAYLDWEFGLVAQLARDGTHGFRVLPAA